MNDPYWMCHACIEYREGQHWKTGNTHCFGVCSYCDADSATLTPVVDIKWKDVNAVYAEWDKIRSRKTKDGTTVCRRPE